MQTIRHFDLGKLWRRGHGISSTLKSNVHRLARTKVCCAGCEKGVVTAQVTAQDSCILLRPCPSSGAERNDAALDRYTHFRELWEAVSSTHPTIKEFRFPAKEAVFSSRSFFTAGLRSENVEEVRRRKFTELLSLLVGTLRALTGGGGGLISCIAGGVSP